MSVPAEFSEARKAFHAKLLEATLTTNGDCVDFAHAREVIADARALLAARTSDAGTGGA